MTAPRGWFARLWLRLFGGRHAPPAPPADLRLAERLRREADDDLDRLQRRGDEVRRAMERLRVESAGDQFTRLAEETFERRWR